MKPLPALAVLLFLIIPLFVSHPAAAQQDTATKQLKEVQVTAARPYITRTADKIVVNVAQSAAAAGATGFEVLQKSPGVQIDQEGNITLNGKPVTVYIDGRRSPLTRTDLKNQLGSMTSAGIDKIELMSTPSAKYDAQGAAIINITTLKNRNQGLNGTLTLGGGFGRYPRTSEGISLNYRKGNANIYGGYDHNYTQQFNSNQSDRYLKQEYTIKDDNYQVERTHSHNLKAGVDYDLSKSTTMGILLKGTLSNRRQRIDNNTGLGFPSQPPDSSVHQLSSGNMDIRNPAVNAYLKTGNEKKGSELTVNLDYFNYNKNWRDGFAGCYFYGNNPSPERDYLLRNHSTSNINLYGISADYTRATKFANIEAGLKSTYTESDNDMLWENEKDGKWQNDVQKSNRFIYKENINAAYIGASKTIKKVTLSATLRAEHTNASGHSVTTTQRFTRDYVQLFPSLNVAYVRNEKNQYSFSYRKSIERFGYELVNPFITYRNAYTYEQGNPDIKPAVTHTVEGVYTYNQMLFATVGFMHSKDNISLLYKQDAERKILINTFANQGRYNLLYTNLMFNKAITPWFQTTNVLMGMYMDIQTGLDTIVYKKKSMAAVFTTQNTFTLPKQFSLEVNASIQTPFTTGYFTFKGFGNLDLGVRKSLWDNKASIKLAVSDVLNTKRLGFNVHYLDIDTRSLMRMDTRVVNLSFTYKFGNSQVKQHKERKNAIESESNRTNKRSF